MLIWRKSLPNDGEVVATFRFVRGGRLVKNWETLLRFLHSVVRLKGVKILEVEKRIFWKAKRGTPKGTVVPQRVEEKDEI